MKSKSLMAGVSVLFLVAFLCVAPPASAQRCPELDGFSQTYRQGQEPVSVRVAGSHAFLGNAIFYPFGSIGSLPGWEADGLNVIDISDPEGPRIVARWSTGGALDAAGILMYDLREGLTITDISDPANPIEILPGSEYDLASGPIAVSGDLVFIAGLDGLTIHNVSDPEHPFEVGRLTTQWLPTRLVVEGDNLFVGEQGGGVRIFNVSSPADPHEVGAWESASGIRDLVVSDGFAYLACGLEGVQVVDVSDPAEPTELEIFDGVDEAWGLSISGSLATFALGENGVGVFDISNPLQPEMLTVFGSAGPVWDVALSDQTAYLAVGLAGESVPPFRREIESLSEISFRGLGGFQVVDLSNPVQPVELAAFGFQPTVLDVTEKDGIEYFALGDAGISVGPHPGRLCCPPEELDTPGYAVGITLYDQYALVADLHKGLRIIDVSDPSHMREVSFIDTPGQAHDVAVSGDHAYIADGGSGLRIVDISSPEAPIERGAVDTPGTAIDVVVSNDFAYVADSEGGLRIIDISNPFEPTEVYDSNRPLDARAVAVSNDMAFVVSRFVPFGEWTDFHVLDVSDPTAPRVVGSNEFHFRGEPTDIALSGWFAYVTTRGNGGIWSGGLEIVDFSNVYQLQRVGEWEHTEDVSGQWVTGGRAYLAGGEVGVPILDARCLTTYWVDIVAHQPGARDSEWRSDVIINNERRRRDGFFAKTESSNPYSVEFFLHTSDGVFTIDGGIVPEGQGVFEDIVGMFGYEGMGALEVHTEVPVSVSSRVYSDTGAGTFGASSRAYSSSDCLGPHGDSGWLYGLRQVAGEYRTNISVTNTGTEPRFASITLYRTDGTSLGIFGIRVDPGMVVQDLQPFKRRAQEPNLGWGFARVEGEGFLASATVIDSRTNDAVHVRMVR